MTEVQIEKYLKSLMDQLMENTNQKRILLTAEWVKVAPSVAGVYMLIEKNKIIYVGESGNLRGRMRDILDTRHHVVRRTIGKKYFSCIRGFKEATSRTKFPPHIEKMVDTHLRERIKISFLEVPLGRKELEEYIQIYIDGDVKLNKRGKRKS